MAMTPEEKNNYDKLEKLVMSLYRVENIEFIKNIERRIATTSLSLGSLSDVDVTGVTNGQVIKYNSSTEIWQAGDDNT